MFRQDPESSTVHAWKLRIRLMVVVEIALAVAWVAAERLTHDWLPPELAAHEVDPLILPADSAVLGAYALVVLAAWIWVLASPRGGRWLYFFMLASGVALVFLQTYSIRPGLPKGIESFLLLWEGAIAWQLLTAPKVPPPSVD